MKSQFKFGGAMLAMSLHAARVFAQCDTATPGNFTDTRFDSGAACSDTGGHDDNGGWNETPHVFIEAGTRSAEDSFRVTGVVGTYNRECDGGADDTRDLDWIRFHVNSPCYITVSLSMRDSSGAPLDGTNKYDLLFIEEGSDPDTAIDLYGEYGTDGCPHVAVYTFPNGTQQALFPVHAGDVLLVVTTPFPPAGDNLAYHGPMAYGLDVVLTDGEGGGNYCFAATNNCTTTSSTGGCSDVGCCQVVCAFHPTCCEIRWDAGCVQDAVEQCNIICDPIPCTCAFGLIPNDCMVTAELVTSLPAFISFDCTNADTDGPNDVAHLCPSNTAHDLWWVVGPTPYAGDVLVTMCGLGNTGDAVISVFDLGQTGDLGNPSELRYKYVACRDDTCDDNGDGSIDTGGPAGINLIGIPAGEFLLVRVGSYLDPEQPNAPGFAGTMQISFRAALVDHGTQRTIYNNGVPTNLGLISGDVNSINRKRWSMVPFTMTQGGTVDGFNFAAFDNTSPDAVSYKVIARTAGDASYGDCGRPFGDGNYSDSQVIAAGSEPCDMQAYSNVGDDYQQRYFIDLTSPFHLDAGHYYFTIYGQYQDGSSGASFAWLLYGNKSEQQKTTAAVNIPQSDAANTAAAGYGDFPAGTPFGWRGIGLGPKLCFYTLGPTYTTHAGDDPGLLYQCVFNLMGTFDAPCTGDLDGSGEVDSGDLGLLLLSYGPCAGGCGGADLDGSGEVDSADLGLLLLSFGACP
jgi:hypothetical protein